MANSLRGEIRDQLAHFAAAILALAPAAAWPGPWSFAWAGFAIGMVREITEEQRGRALRVPMLASVLTSRNSMRDVLFWTLGGAAAWFLGGGHV